MDTTMRPAAPDLQASLRHLRRLAAVGVVALGLLGIAAGGAAPVDAEAAASYGTGTGAGAGAGKVSTNDRAVAGDPSQWGVSGNDPEFPVTPNIARKVNEYEGQHR